MSRREQPKPGPSPRTAAIPLGFWASVFATVLVISSGITAVGVAREDLLEPPLFVIDDLKDGDFTNALSGFWRTLTQEEYDAGGPWQQALPGQDGAVSMRLSHVSATIVSRQSQDWIDWSFATVGWLQLRTWIAPYDATHAKGVYMILDSAQEIDLTIGIDYRQVGSGSWEEWELRSASAPVHLAGGKEETVVLPFDEFLVDELPWTVLGGNTLGDLDRSWLESMALIAMGDGTPATVYLREIGFCGVGATPVASSAGGTPVQPDAVTIPGLESLGNPFLRRYPGDAELAYPRTVWDMQAWNGRIYLGHGDSGSNAGPIDVWYYAPDQTRFVNEFSVDDEQISRYCRIGDSLFIPGHDAMESWDFGNIYVNESAGWQKLRTIPNAIHVYDLAMYEGRLYAVGSGELPGGSTTLDGGFIGVSDDGGWSWGIDLHLGPFCEDGITRVRDASDPGVARFTSLLELQGKLFASGWGTSRIYELGPDGFSLLEVDPFPGIASQFDEPPLIPPNEVDMSSAEIDRMWGDPKVAGYIARSVQFSGPLVYIGGVMSWTPYEPWQGIGVFAATAMQDGQIRRVLDLGATWEPRDLTVSGDKLYVLSVSPTDGGFRSRVDVTLDLSEWAVALDFMADAPAFSIEVLDGYLYVGLGGVYPSSGNIYRAKLSGE